MSQTAKNKGASFHWILLRVLAVLLIGLSVWLGWFVYQAIGMDHAQFIELLSKPWNASAMIALALCSAAHGLLGVKEVVQDYIHNPTLKKIKMIAVRGAFLLFLLTIIGCVLVIKFNVAQA